MSTRLVSEILDSKSRQLFTVPPDASVQDALQIMVTRTISCLLVTQGPDLIGILSERDYIRKAVPKRVAPWDLKVKDIMTEKVICVTPVDTIHECMERMVSNRIRHLPVVDRNALVGILSISDIVRALRPAQIDFPPS